MRPESKLNELEESYEPVREIFGRPPAWIIRWGSTLIFIFFLSLAFISLIVKYPDVVSSPARLSSVNAPKVVMVKQTGKLIRLNKADGDNVAQNEVIGCTESTGNIDDILQLEKYIDCLSANFKKRQVKAVLPEQAFINKFSINQLGELQLSYQGFVQAQIVYGNYINDGVILKRLQLLRNDVANLEASKASLIEQQNLYTQDLSLSKTTFDANEKLLKDKVISQQEYRELTSSLISKKLTLPQAKMAMINIASQTNDKQKEILELNAQIESQRIVFQEAINNLKSQIEDWKNKHLLVAPITGKLNFNTFVQVNQQLYASQIIGFVTPSDNKYFVQLSIPQANFGKVSIGQKVLLKFPSFPWQEYGSVEGRIDYISAIPSDSGEYLARACLANGLTTNHKVTIRYREGLIAQADIVTQEKRLLQRFYYSLLRN